MTEDRSARKRRIVVDAATTLFLRHGYLGTSMDQIAAFAAVSKPTVYKFFPDKELAAQADAGASAFLAACAAM
jgi:TetR/AcrR family transcriptional regulator, mexJK operon transcriptional repressor